MFISIGALSLKQETASSYNWGWGKLTSPPHLTKIELTSRKLIQSIWKFQGCFRPIIQSFSDVFGAIPRLHPSPRSNSQAPQPKIETILNSEGKKAQLYWYISRTVEWLWGNKLSKTLTRHQKRCPIVVFRTVAVQYLPISKFQVELNWKDGNFRFKLYFPDDLPLQNCLKSMFSIACVSKNSKIFRLRRAINTCQSAIIDRLSLYQGQ